MEVRIFDPNGQNIVDGEVAHLLGGAIGKYLRLEDSEFSRSWYEFNLKNTHPSLLRILCKANADVYITEYFDNTLYARWKGSNQIVVGGSFNPKFSRIIIVKIGILNVGYDKMRNDFNNLWSFISECVNPTGLATEDILDFLTCLKETEDLNSFLRLFNHPALLTTRCGIHLRDIMYYQTRNQDIYYEFKDALDNLCFTKNMSWDRRNIRPDLQQYCGVGDDRRASNFATFCFAVIHHINETLFSFTKCHMTDLMLNLTRSPQSFLLNGMLVLTYICLNFGGIPSSRQ